MDTPPPTEFEKTTNHPATHDHILTCAECYELESEYLGACYKHGAEYCGECEMKDGVRLYPQLVDTRNGD